MFEETKILLKEWNSSTKDIEPTGESISIYTISKSMTLDNFSKFFDEFLNLGAKDFQDGKQVGLKLRFTHRSLQRLAICFAFGIIVGLSQQEFTDARNETAIQTAKKIKTMIDLSELPFGLYI